jgi:SPP1 gp7 family putative phage head morphogenesis protein
MAFKLNPKMTPKETAEFFRKKGIVPPEKGFSWLDIEKEEHARALTVAKANSVSLLEDLHDALAKASSEGMTLRDFQQRMKPVAIENGWWGKKTLIDPVTKLETEVQLGSPRRLEIIYDTNMRTSRATGRWARIQDRKDVAPFLQYSAVRDGRTRPLHASWHGIVLPVDDPWWETNFPPNGWRCRCITNQLSARSLRFDNLKVSERPNDGTFRFLNKRTGEIRTIPSGIDPGFDYNPGQSGAQALVRESAEFKAGKKITEPANLNPVAVDEMTPPRSISNDLLLRANDSDGRPRSAEFFVETFLQVFGGGIGLKPVYFKDITGHPLAISDRMFLSGKNKYKVLKNEGHSRHVLLVAETLKNPDEIWNVTGLDEAGKTIVRRRYLARFQYIENGEQVDLMSIYETSNIGYSADILTEQEAADLPFEGVTGFAAQGNDNNYILRIRKGHRVYVRP